MRQSNSAMGLPLHGPRPTCRTAAAPQPACSLPSRSPVHGLVERVLVIFYDKAHVPVEKFVFKLAVNQSYGSKIEEANLEFALRAFLIKLTVAEPLTRSLPSDGEKEALFWIPTDSKQWMQPRQKTPIKSMSCDPVKMQLYLEQPSPHRAQGSHN
ncbi:hypothetical protein E2562_026246 [Oryza meyeriana var. granulata]|uniref:HORMA domain-containing protein n=1 Tax=Oryza meyeriana var. granulata TaxID=110450 RepID=A0A6G1CJR2_9ORYZ|nr:hypothetical protein E2562_026246 [Oryza meyeriana var. granulata]